MHETDLEGRFEVRSYLQQKYSGRANMAWHRQAWYDYCLINPSGRPNKFLANDRFGEKIILLNKEKVRPSANAKSDEFLRETVAPNVLSLWSCKEAVSRATGAISHGNRHSLVAKLPDVSLLVKHMIDDSIFEEKLGHIGMPNNTSISVFPDLFYVGSAHLSNSIAFSKYIDSARGNKDNLNLDDGYMSDTANNDSPESEPEDPNGSGDNPDNPDKLDGIYD